MGRLIVIEGIDGSGKATQAKLLHEYLTKLGKKVKKITFPNYASGASAPVKMYLAGKFGTNPDDVNPYAASTLFAVDRFASYKTTWSRFLSEEESFVIADRYVTSNIVHQASKIEDADKKAEFISWLDDFEYEKMGLPRPDAVLFLDVRPEMSQKLIENRVNKFTGGKKKDIHEVDFNYLSRSYENALIVSEKYNWSHINCESEGTLKAPQDICGEMIRELERLLII